MKTVNVSASGSYDVFIGQGLLTRSGQLIRSVLPKAEKIAIITDDIVDALYAETLVQSLESQGCKTGKLVLENGEESKNGGTFLRILEFLAENQLTRSDAVVALGGGMVGDIAGFASACYLRGIKYVQIPTTLLAMVDSSVGGKTAIDLSIGKNLAGAFCQPSLVICDHSCLNSLPEDIFSDGCAEVIKYGILGDAELFAHLEEKGRDFDREYVIHSCVSMKRDYVCEDEFDTGVRRMLNLGHTLGHAVEIKSDFALSHGKSVAIGLAAVARAANIADGERICALLEKFALPVKTEYTIHELFAPMLSDKKRLGSKVNVIVPECIGKCKVQEMALDELKSFMKAGL